MPVAVQERHFICFTSADVKQIVDDVEVVPAAAVAGDAEVTLDVGLLMSTNLPAPLRRKKLALQRIEVMRATGASATNYTPQIADATGAATTAWTTKYLGAATAPGTRFDVTGIDGPMYSSTAGLLYFQPNGDAADTFDYAIWFEVLG